MITPREAAVRYAAMLLPLLEHGIAEHLETLEGQFAAAVGRIDELEEEVRVADERWAGTLDATFAVGDGTAQAEIERLRAELQIAALERAETLSSITSTKANLEWPLGAHDEVLVQRDR